MVRSEGVSTLDRENGPFYCEIPSDTAPLIIIGFRRSLVIGFVTCVTYLQIIEIYNETCLFVVEYYCNIIIII